MFFPIIFLAKGSGYRNFLLEVEFFFFLFELGLNRRVTEKSLLLKISILFELEELKI